RGGTKPAPARAPASRPRSGAKAAGGADTRPGTGPADPCSGLETRVVLDGFDLNGASVKPVHQAKILQVARCIAATQKTSQPIRSVRVVGHTGPEGSSAHNAALGLKRASEVRRHLVEALERTVPGSSGRVTIVPESRGEREASSPDPAKRRRVEVLLPLPEGRPSRTQPSQPRFSQALTPTSPPAVPAGIVALVGKALGMLPFGGVRPPTAARFLDPAEQGVAASVFGGSLDLTRILISDGLGFQQRPFTVAVRDSSGWYVVMNLGSLRSWSSRGRDSWLLVHELAHAWQSQHHGKDPQAFMMNSVKCQSMAMAAQAANFSGEKYSAYAYVPGKAFGDYAAEQIATQVEHSYSGRGSPTQGIMQVVRSVRPNARSPENEKSLTVVSFHARSTPGVVWV
ncbi:MAG TPA: OmpA family protein, partial [Longimicrobiaceae bacterium]|nr:OmpA family protein [Longimicrobiaceae bacterium]